MTPDPLLSADRERETAGSYTEPRTKAGQRLDLAWPAEMDRLAWRKAITAIEIEAEASVDRFALSSPETTPAPDAGLRADIASRILGLGVEPGRDEASYLAALHAAASEAIQPGEPEPQRAWDPNTEGTPW